MSTRQTLNEIDQRKIISHDCLKVLIGTRYDLYPNYANKLN